MTLALWLLLVQGLLGAFDTLYYHEWRARLPGRAAQARSELRLHAWRDFIYAVVFVTLPWIAWQGGFCLVLGGLLTAEIAITLADFIVEDRVRAPWGGVYSGERATHAIMGITYGAMLAYLVPELMRWWAQPAAMVYSPHPLPEAVRWTLTAMGAGVLLSGLRDLAAVFELPGSSWPWRTE